MMAAVIMNAAVGSPTPGKADAAKIQKNMAKNKGDYIIIIIIIIIRRIIILSYIRY